jgi:hypothetical protein
MDGALLAVGALSDVLKSKARPPCPPPRSAAAASRAGAVRRLNACRHSVTGGHRYKGMCVCATHTVWTVLRRVQPAALPTC